MAFITCVGEVPPTWFLASTDPSSESTLNTSALMLDENWASFSRGISGNDNCSSIA